MTRGWGGRAGAGVLVLIALGVGQAIGSVPRYDATFEAPHPVDGRVGEAVPMRAGSLLVTSAQVGTSAGTGVGGLVTDDAFVLVTLEFTPNERDDSILWAELRDTSGRTWSNTVHGTRNCMLVPPHLTGACYYLIEAPAEALPGATIALSTSANDQRFDSMAVVDLGLDADQVEAGTTTGAHLDIPYTALVDPGSTVPGGPSATTPTGAGPGPTTSTGGTP